MDNVKRYTVSIGGQQYVIVSDEHPESITSAAQIVDEMISSVLQNRNDVPREKAAVLAALKLAQHNQSLQAVTSDYDTRSHKLAACIDEHL